MFDGFDDHITELRTVRGRYPVSNLIGDFLKAQPAGASFKLGHWLQTLDIEVLEDVQTKLDMFLSSKGPDHAGEDLIVAVDLLSSAEVGTFIRPSDQEIKRRMAAWFEAGFLTKLSRAGLVNLDSIPSINPDVPCSVEMPAAVIEQLTAQSAVTSGTSQ